MGLLMDKELQYLEGELENPARPFLVILGGAKVSDKIGVIKALMEKADVFLIGGAEPVDTLIAAIGRPSSVNTGAATPRSPLAISWLLNA